MNDWNHEQPAPRALFQILRVRFPQVRFGGLHVPKKVEGTNALSTHAEGRAIDVNLLSADPLEGPLGDRLYELLVRRASTLGLDHVIWNRSIWSAHRGGPRPYFGRRNHYEHLHVAFTRESSQRGAFPELIDELEAIAVDMQRAANACRR